MKTKLNALTMERRLAAQRLTCPVPADSSESQTDESQAAAARQHSKKMNQPQRPRKLAAA